MMRHFLAGLLFVIAISIAGCAGLPTREAESLPVSDNNAVIALADAGRADAANGKLDAAVAS